MIARPPDTYITVHKSNAHLRALLPFISHWLRGDGLRLCIESAGKIGALLKWESNGWL